MIPTERIINDYTLVLEPDVNEIWILEDVLKKLAKLGEKAKLEKFVTQGIILGLPVKHNLYISSDGTVSIDIFEDENCKELEKPLNYKIGTIIDFKLKKL